MVTATAARVAHLWLCRTCRVGAPCVEGWALGVPARASLVATQIAWTTETERPAREWTPEGETQW